MRAGRHFAIALDLFLSTHIASLYVHISSRQALRAEAAYPCDPPPLRVPILVHSKLHVIVGRVGSGVIVLWRGIGSIVSKDVLWRVDNGRNGVSPVLGGEGFHQGSSLAAIDCLGCRDFSTSSRNKALEMCACEKCLTEEFRQVSHCATRQGLQGPSTAVEGHRFRPDVGPRPFPSASDFEKLLYGAQ